MNLVIDIGNTVAKIALFDGENIVEVIHDDKRTLSLLPDVCKKYPIEKGILSTVVTLTDRVKRQLNRLPFNLVRLDHLTPLPTKTITDIPESMGADRLAAIVGAMTTAPNKDLLIVDAGTAMTFEFIDAAGHYYGGNISPGLKMRLKALNIFCDKLPLVDKKGDVPMFGYDTDTAIRAGVIKGMEYEIHGYIDTLTKKYPGLLVFLTGGNEFSFDTNLKSIIFADRFLVLKGLNRILEYNGRI